MADIEKATDSHRDNNGHEPHERTNFFTPVPQPNYRQLGNPAPLGLFSFASTTLILSLVNVQARHVNVPNIVVGMALGVGGLAQLLAGMWEFASGNTFGATAFSSYGGFWISWALIYWPSSGIVAGYSGPDAGELGNAVGFYLLSWFIFTFLMWLGSLRSTFGLSSLFFFLWVTFLFLAIGAITGNVKVTKAGGGFGILTAAIAYYCAAAAIITHESSYFPLPLGHLPKKKT